MAFDLDGADALRDSLMGMASQLAAEGPALNRALKAGARPIEAQMKRNASSDPKIITGELYGSIRTSGVKGSAGGSGGKRITIGVHHQDNAAYFSNSLEYGHGGPAPAPAHPFLRPAFDAQADTAYEEMKKELRAALDRRG